MRRLSNTFAIHAPAKTDRAIVNMLNQQLAEAVNQPALTKTLDAGFFEAVPPKSPEQVRKAFLAEYDKWDKVVKPTSSWTSDHQAINIHRR